METNFLVLLPEIILAVAGLLVIGLTPFLRGQNGRLTALALAGAGAAAVCTVVQWGQEGPGFFGMVELDGFVMISRLLFITATAIVAFMAHSYLERHRLPTGDFLGLLLFSSIGMCLMVSSADSASAWRRSTSTSWGSGATFQ